MDLIETRSTLGAGAPTVVQRQGPTGARTISGLAAVFYDSGAPGTEYALGPGMVERIDRRAFERAIRGEDDATSLWNHDANLPLGRLSAGTLRLSVDSRGLRYEVALPDTNAGRDAYESIKRRDVKGSSFIFHVLDESWAREGETLVRTVRSVRLISADPVTWPAYEATTVDARVGTATPQWEIDAQGRERQLELLRRRHGPAS